MVCVLAILLYSDLDKRWRILGQAVANRRSDRKSATQFETKTLVFRH